MEKITEIIIVTLLFAALALVIGVGGQMILFPNYYAPAIIRDHAPIQMRCTPGGENGDIVRLYHVTIIDGMIITDTLQIGGMACFWDEPGYPPVW